MIVLYNRIQRPTNLIYEIWSLSLSLLTPVLLGKFIQLTTYIHIHLQIGQLNNFNIILPSPSCRFYWYILSTEIVMNDLGSYIFQTVSKYMRSVEDKLPL